MRRARLNYIQSLIRAKGPNVFGGPYNTTAKGGEFIIPAEPALIFTNWR